MQIPLQCTGNMSTAITCRINPYSFMRQITLKAYVISVSVSKISQFSSCLPLDTRDFRSVGNVQFA